MKSLVLSFIAIAVLGLQGCNESSEAEVDAEDGSTASASFASYATSEIDEDAIAEAATEAAEDQVAGTTYADQGYPYGCTEDCSGHDAGYEWAEENEVNDPDDCGGNSISFEEGCRARAEAFQEAYAEAQEEAEQEARAELEN